MKHIIHQIIEIVAEEFGVIPNAIKSRSKTEELSLPRLAAMHLSWRYVGAADRTISYYFNRKNGNAYDMHGRQFQHLSKPTKPLQTYTKTSNRKLIYERHQSSGADRAPYS